MHGPDPEPTAVPDSDEAPARGHRRLGEHLHDVEDHLLDTADGDVRSSGDAEVTRRRAHRLSADADREPARADRLDPGEAATEQPATAQRAVRAASTARRITS